MRNFWAKYPALRLLIPFTTGIITHILLPGFWLPATLVLFISIAVIFIYIISKRIWLKPHSFFTSGIAPVVAVASLAYLLTFLQTENYRPHHFSNFVDKEDCIIAMVDEPPLEKQNTLRTVLRVRQLSSSSRTISATGKISVSFIKDSLSAALRYGDVLLLNSEFSEIEAPKNPAQFNYREYMSFHNIYHQTFVSAGKWKLIERAQGNPLLVIVFKVRESLMDEIKKFVTTPDELGVAGALLLGYRDFITPDITQAYSSSGALHVLCVSGLHVGMVYLILSKLLFFMNKNRRLRIAQTLIIILCIWLYACLTGLSPSVLRAATMFSMIAGGKAFKQKPDIYNIIGASALVLMVYNPYIMTEVGFKLSYFAVLGIVYMQPIIYSWLVLKNKIADWLWSITAVSVAAQAATFPLGLLYFHQFPNLFWVSNIVVIPAGYVLIVTGIAMFASQIFYPIQWLFGTAFYWLSLGLNKFIFLLNDFPYSITQGISISGIETILIYGLILLLTFMLKALRFSNLMWFLFILLALTIWNSYEYYTQQKQTSLTVYSVKGKSALAVANGNHVFKAFDSTLLANSSSMLFHVKHHWWQMDLGKEVEIHYHKSVTPFDFGYGISVNAKRILVIENWEQTKNYPIKKIAADVVVISNAQKPSLESIEKLTDAPTVVADATIKPYIISKWKQQAPKQKIKLHDVMKDGAFVL